jgi:hypothetical protein
MGPGGTGTAGEGGAAAGEGGAGGGGPDCSKAPVPGCACIKVSPDGDDVAASASNGATPFRTVQTAIDFANTHRDVSTAICVAQGATCSATHDYDGTAWMHDGLRLYGGYQTTSWTRCAGSNTRIAVENQFVGFDFTGSGPSIIDGVTVVGYAYVESATNVVFNDVRIVPVPGASTADALSIRNNAQVTVTASDIVGTVLIRASDVSFVDDDIEHVSNGAGSTIVLYDHPSSLRIDSSRVSITATPPGQATALSVNTADVPVTLTKSVFEASGATAVALAIDYGGAITVTGNTLTVLASNGNATGLAAAFDASGQFANNIIGVQASLGAATGISTSSMCQNLAIANNQIQARGDTILGIGVQGCSTVTDVRVESNTVTATSPFTNGVGVDCSATGCVVADNDFVVN